MSRAGRWQPRYTVLSILFLACIVRDVDRMAMSIAIPFIATDFHLTPAAMGVVMSIFFASYALSQIPGGMLADRFGVRTVATVALVWWSAFTAITGAAANFVHMLIARLGFGFGEGVFPACAFKTVAVWFPKKERATANAIMLASGSIGAALAPLAVIGIVAHWGWRAVFYSLSVPGLLIALLFWVVIRDKPREPELASPVQNVELDSATTGSAETAPAKVRLLEIVKQPLILRFILIYFFFDIAYWGLTNWLPTYLVRSRGFSMQQMGIAAALPQVAGVVGAFVGGWSSDRFFKNHRRVPIMAAQIASAICLYLTFTTTSLPLVVVYQIVAGFSLNFFFTAFWAVPMNTVPVGQMGTTTGVVNMAGQTAAFISPMLVGYLVGASGGSFDVTFMLFIACLLISCAVVFTIPHGQDRAPEEAIVQS